MSWKAIIVRRLEYRNSREMDPMIEKMFTLISRRQSPGDLSDASPHRANNTNASTNDSRDKELYLTAAAQLFESQQRNKELHSSLELVRAQLQEKMSSIEQLKYTCALNENLKAELSASHVKNEELENEIAALRVELEEKLAFIEQLQQQVNKIIAENAELKAVNQTILSEFEALRDTFTKFQEKMVDELMENSRLKKTNEKLKQDFTHSRSVSVSLSNEPSREPSPTPESVGRKNSASSSISVTPAGAKTAFLKFTSFLRSSSTNADLSEAQGEVNDEFQVVSLPDVCIACAYPTKAVTSFDAHDGDCSAVKWSPMSRFLATAGSDRTVKFWSAETLSNPFYSNCLSGVPSGILALEFDSSEQNLAAACTDNTARIWRISIKKETHVLGGHTDYVTAVRFGVAGESGVITGSRDRTIRLWDSNFCNVTRTIVVPSRVNDLVRLSGSGFSMASGHSNKTICIWDHRAEKSKPVAEVILSDKVTSLDVNGSLSYRLLALTKDSTLHIVDIRMNKIALSLSNEGFIINSELARAVFSPDGQYVCSGSMVGPITGSLHIWNSSTGNIVATVLRQSDASPIVGISWQPSGRYVATVDKKRRCTLWSDI